MSLELHNVTFVVSSFLVKKSIPLKFIFHVKALIECRPPKGLAEPCWASVMHKEVTTCCKT